MGFEVLTADAFLRGSGVDSAAAFAITEMTTPLTTRLAEVGVGLKICHSTESPLNAHKFYHNIVQYAKGFEHNFHFEGVRERLAGSSAQFHSLVFPVETRIQLPEVCWGKRKSYVMINSNKRAFRKDLASIRGLPRALASMIRFYWWRLNDPWFRIPEGYIYRLNAIEAFSKGGGFELYGRGWERPVPGFRRRYQESIRKCYTGSIDDDIRIKRNVLSHFKFALCFENCAFPGYITEKITDAILAGSIPIYWGAPDIENFIPRGAFIDARRFASFPEIREYTQSLSEREIGEFLAAGGDFLRSGTFDRFDLSYLITHWLEIIHDS